MSDKRKYPRLKLNADLSITVEGKSKYFKMIDFSRGGMSFISERVIVDGTMLEFDMHHSSFHIVVLEGDFEWLCEDSALAGYKVRCIFKPELDDPKWSDLEKYFHELELITK